MNNKDTDLKEVAFAFLGVKKSLLKSIEVLPGFSGDISLSRPRQCFDNIWRYCSLMPDRYEYCLCVTFALIPIEHAIIYDRVTATYFDPTFESASLDIGKDYLLIKQFTKDQLLEHAFEYGYPPMLEHCNNLIERNRNYFKESSLMNAVQSFMSSQSF